MVPRPGAQYRAAERRRRALRRGRRTSMEGGIERARKAIARGEAKHRLDEFVEFTQRAKAKD